MNTVVWGSSLGMYLQSIYINDYIKIHQDTIPLFDVLLILMNIKDLPEKLDVVPVPLDAVEAALAPPGPVQDKVAGELDSVANLDHGGQRLVLVQGDTKDTWKEHISLLLIHVIFTLNKTC